jgi:phosphinothricin acetyltransferase
MARRVREVEAASLPWLVADEDGAVLGYAYASPWKKRPAYRYAVEITVYLDPEATHRGLGTALYRSLFSKLRDRPVHAVIGGIALPNPESVRLHEKFGMRKVAHFEAVGFKFSHWIDVAYWEVRLHGGPPPTEGVSRGEGP